MDLHKELNLLESISSFEVPVIPDDTRFWMIRTQKGYFYQEFMSKEFVAIAWNNISESTDFSEQARERLSDDIMLNYPEIQRPSTVINKCHNFICEVKEGDILVIPSKGSEYITFALAGQYYEDNSKTVELENKVIYRIKNNDVDINDVSCPYKKRRVITILRTVRSEQLNYSLYRAISNYHGISNFDTYAHQILNCLYNCYVFKGSAVLVYNVTKNTPIKPRELSGLLYSNTECLSKIIDEDKISTQVSLNSPGDAIYILEDIYTFAKDNWAAIFGLLVFLGGGSALSFHVNGIIDVIKSILSAPADIRIKKATATEKELEVLNKKLEIYEKIKASGINPEDLAEPLDTLYKNTMSLETKPIVLQTNSASILPPAGAEFEIVDLDDEPEE